MKESLQTQHTLKNISKIFRTFGTRSVFQPGEIIFLKNEPADYIYYIFSGQVRAFLVYPDGNERTLIFINEGTCGEEAFANPPVRIVCANAVTKTTMYRLDPNTLFRECMKDEVCARELLASFMKKITLLHSWIFYAQFVNNDKKIACLLYSMTRQDGDKIHLTHEQIAAVTGMSRVTATRVLKILVEKQLISQEYKHIIALNRDGLKDIFEDKVFY